ncbi:glycosyl hydrolase family 8 [Bacillus sp. JCM 19034]|uniref:glycosyl hydrolase family 8 n=1 Tax=Bacillus sp. JCM 19034 TaxID=1481928 RepID=UPI0009E9B28D|nr:glycosyl hydrolase family 8 [Bacillus sp. JCM 19034]
MVTHKGAFYNRNYRNLFAYYGYTSTEINQKVEDTWNKLFYGDDETKIYFDVDDAYAYILDTGNQDVRTEGMSYGMMMAVQMNDQTIFNKLWNWAKTYMYMDYGENAGYFAWSCKRDGTKLAHGPAPDGEEFFAMALFFASHRWGMTLNHLITENKLKASFTLAFIKGRIMMAFQCGIQKTISLNSSQIVNLLILHIIYHTFMSSLVCGLIKRIVHFGKKQHMLVGNTFQKLVILKQD